MNHPHPDRAELLRRLEEGPLALARAVASVPVEIRKRRPGPKKWSVHEIVLHVSDTELMYSGRIRRTLAMERPQITAFDQDVFAQNLDYHDQDLDLALEAFSAVRRMNIALLRTRGEAAYARGLVHSENGDMTLRDLARLMAEHPFDHVEQIRVTVASLRAQRPTAASERWARDGNLAFTSRGAK